MKLFSKDFPTMRLVWDPTTINSLMKNPLEYYWKYVLGYRSINRSIDLEWGTAWDKAMELYHRLRRECEQRESLYRTIEGTIKRAEATELDAIAAESKKANKKNLSTLIRSIVWYDQEWGDYPFYEVVSSIPTTVEKELFKLPNGESVVVVANFDQLVKSKETGKYVVVERKSTSDALSDYYFKQYDPSTQINTYDWIAHETFSTEGVWVEACQTAVGFTRFAYHECHRTPEHREHWRRVMEFWISFSYWLATNDNWEIAMNLGTQRWESNIRDIQRRPPSVWENMLRAEFEKRPVWNPFDID